MLFWKEVLVTQDVNKLNKIKEVLNQNGIESYSKVSDRSSSTSPLFAIFGTRRRSGTLGEKSRVQMTYYLYVKKKDLELAKALTKLI